MIFSSYPFLFYFLPFTWVGFFVLSRILVASAHRPQVLMAWLLLSSCWFYAQWHLPDLFLLLAVASVNFAVVATLSQRGISWVVPAVVALNLLVLAFFKYWPWLDGEGNRGVLLAGLPLGISFYIFQVIAFQIDLSRGHTDKPAALNFVVFLSFFPQLIAGPIVHGRRLLPQLSRLGDSPCCIGLGCTLLVLGLSKKVLVADSLAGGVDAIYAGQYGFDTISVLAAAFGYGTQLYFDFSGYADMAVGLGLLFGIRLPQNFRGPYSAHSLTEFWRRWHITLSSFLRDYLYISLGGNRLGALRKSANLFITMALGGLWHGAGLQFLLWGAAHGALLAAEHGFRQFFPGLTGVLPKLIASAATLLIVMLLWLPFRADNLSQTASLLSGLLHWIPAGLPSVTDLLLPLQRMSSSASTPLVLLIWVVCALACLRLRPTAWRWALAATPWQRGLVSGALFAMVLKTLTDRPEQPFLYFQF